jgi:hypothetical protein
MAYNIKYPTRRKMANVLKKVLRDNFLVDTGTLVDSVRINAEITDKFNLRIQINAAYYFGFLNNGTQSIGAYNLVRKFDVALDAAGIYAEIWGGYTEYLLTEYPILEVGNILDRAGDIFFDFNPLFGDFYPTLDY